MSDFPITIPGQPVPQGSHRVSRSGRVFDANPALKAWRRDAIARLDQWTGTYFGAWVPLDGPVHVSVTFYLKRGKTVTREYPSVKPDLDKLQRALGDALTYAGIVTDDSRIVSWHAIKTYSDDPRTVIRNIKETR